MFGAGVVLQKRLPARMPHWLNRAVVDVLMPLLLLLVLARARLDLSLWPVLVATSAAQGVTCLAAIAWARALGLERRTQGSAAMTTTYSNTGFLGFPVLLAVFGTGAAVSSTALVVDAFSTTLLLWTFGVALAARFGDARPFHAAGLVRALVRPMTVCIAAGVALSFTSLQLPPITATVVHALGMLTSALVFLSLGLGLDVGALRHRLAPLSAMASLKLLFMPALVLVGVKLLRVPEPAASVAVLQCAMPSAMVSVIVSTEEGADGPFAAGVAALSTLACVVTLPLVALLLQALADP